jgi:regulator of protease activity HflC (stomatin/prohibitin superfamily)
MIILIILGVIFTVIMVINEIRILREYEKAIKEIKRSWKKDSRY